ncbi:MAG: S9 family peptidase [Ancrocorticia sp.]|jgi:oligopeptidase B|nr:S9 family peptidase [Ancrocorticia sp.]MCI2002743.1 S9 family peptidase [Ancrocorticia sp.]
MTALQPPVAPKIPTERRFHGDVYVDNYEWFRDKTNEKLIAHLEAENAWTEERTKHLHGLQDQLVSELKARTQETDTSLPQRQGNWWYFRHTWEGKQYPALYRVPNQGHRPGVDELHGETLVWDGNALAEGHEFFGVSGFLPSPNGKLGALGVDYAGDEHFTLRIFDIESGMVLDESVANIGYGLAWTADSTGIFYSRVDDAWRQYQVWLHTIGKQTSLDRLLYQENDEKFDVVHSPSRDGNWIIVWSTSRSTSEVRLISAAQPSADPILVCERTPGLDYAVEPAEDHLLIVHNANYPDFELSAAPIRTSTPKEWVTLFSPEPGERVNDVDAFHDFAVISLRSGGEARLRVMRRIDRFGSRPRDSVVYREPHERAIWEDSVPIPSEDLATTELYPTPWWNSQEVVYTTESLLTPPTHYSYTVQTGQVRVLKVQETPGYERSHYTQQGVTVTGRDGTAIPMTIAYRSDITPNGENPGYIYGYGSYEVSNDPYFWPGFISLMDRGVVVAWTHVRGGGELGRAWYEDGRLLSKKNTFTDFIDCSRWLIDQKWVSPGRLAADGRSAGGLLMGAVANMAPETYRAIHAGVPFVDTLTTILNPDLPLTAGEWEEWGNPRESAEVYEYMKSYSPVENVRPVEYPAILATTSLNDIRVFYVEPTKWIQILRENATNDPLTRPILEKIEMVAGHAGKSGRYNKWRNQAFIFAWLLDQIGAA